MGINEDIAEQKNWNFLIQGLNFWTLKLSGWDLTGAKSEEERNIEISALEDNLEQCNKVIRKLESDEMQIEYAQMKNDSYPLHRSIDYKNKENNSEEHYCKVDIQGLMHLIV